MKYFIWENSDFKNPTFYQFLCEERVKDAKYEYLSFMTFRTITQIFLMITLGLGDINIHGFTHVSSALHVIKVE